MKEVSGDLALQEGDLMNKSKKLYLKALDYYQNGYIDKAIEICEESIGINLKNTATINLKGLLYYLKGDIDNCRALWKLNSEINKDQVAKKYLETLKSDDKRLRIYNEAIKNITNLKIREGLELLYQCRESDFNSINVNNNIAMCLIKCAKYKEANIYLQKVLNIDKTNKMARKIKKELEEYGVIKKSKKKLAYLSLIIVSIIAITSSIFYAVTLKYNDSSKNDIGKKKQEVITKEPNKELSQTLEDKKQTDTKKEDSNIKKDKFSMDEMKALISKEDLDYEKIYSYLKVWENNGETKDDEGTIEKARNLLKEKGVEYFYRRGLEFSKNEDYNNAKENLLKAYEYGRENYLYQHTIYFLARTYSNLEDYNNAKKYYEQYDREFEKGSYSETVIYELALLNKDSDIAKAKKYAKKLIKEFPDSQNNNSIVQEILNK